MIISNEISAPLRDLLYKLLNKKLEKRLCDFSEIKAHKWLKDVNWDMYFNKAVKSPITIDFYRSNIHQEFLEVDVDPDAFLEDEIFK